MASSTIPAFKAALVARLEADAGLAGVQVCYGPPGQRALEREAVLVLGTRPDDPTGGGGGQRTAAMGQHRREERYVVEVVVSVLRKARDDQQGTTERAFELAAAVEDSIRAWEDGSKPVRWALVTGVSLREHANQDEREAEVSIDVACSARI